ncbi:MAG: hypothetical protein KY461_02920 [Actinobacteria bacterium]|nr:hypothetical protein [Actinomycetota bacterium]
MKRHLVLFAAVALAVGATPAQVPGGDPVHTDNMRHVGTVTWDDQWRTDDGRKIDTLGGTDVEFATIVDEATGEARDYAFAGTYRNGLQVVDITDPETATRVATYDCQIMQGDVQVFRHPTAGWLASYTADSGYNQWHSTCHDDAGVSGGDVGSFLVDVNDPTAPVAVAFVPFEGGSHNQTVHPDGTHLYNSRSDSAGVLEIADITDLDAVRFTTLDIGRDDSHDITFRADGERAYSAALDHSVIIDTVDPSNPRIVADIVDPAVTLHHQADPVRIGDRDFLVINDELAGAAGNEFCPGGGLHVYDITDEANPEKVGAFFIPEATVAEGARTGAGGAITCTSHVFRMYEEEELLTIAWFGAGVRVVDLSGLGDTPPVSAGVLGETLTPGMREIGFWRDPVDSDAWAAKVFEFDEDGSAYIFSNDQTRGLDIFRFEADAPEASSSNGQWLSPAAALQRTLDLRAAGFEGLDRPYCDLRGRL